ncbi:putative holin-like toxin [Alkalibacillus silvisoli]
METYGFLLVMIGFGSFVVTLLSLIIQIINSITKKK